MTNQLKRIYIFLIIFLFSGIEFSLMYDMFIKNNINFIFFFTVHLILVVISFIIFTFFYKKSLLQSDLLQYFSFVLPGIGFLFSAIIEIFLLINGTKKDLISDFEDHTDFTDDKPFRKTILFDILKQNIEGIKIKHIVKILVDSLSDEDTEVARNASSIINDFDEEYQSRIKILKEKYMKTGNVNYISQVVDIYSEYIDSGLHYDDIREEYINDFIDLISELRQFYRDYNIDLKLAELYMEKNNLINAESIFKELIDELPLRYEAYFGLMKVYYQKNNEKKLVNYARIIKKKKLNLPEDKKRIVDYWTEGIDRGENFENMYY